MTRLLLSSTALAVALVIASPSLVNGRETISTGSGFFVTDDGHILTSYHVIRDAERISVRLGDVLHEAAVLKVDGRNDIALLKIRKSSRRVYLGDSTAASLGDPVFTIGFPNPVVQGFAPKLTKGEVSSLAGMQDDPRLFQISAPIQPGNSGGPLFNVKGEVIGITSSSLSALGMLVAQGALPQNVNYAVKISYAQLLLKAAGLDIDYGSTPNDMIFNQYSDLLPSVCQIVAQCRTDDNTYSLETRGISLRSTVLENGLPRITIRNNNAFYVQNVGIKISFSGAYRSASGRSPTIPWTITDLLPPGMDYEFTVYDKDSISTLLKHSRGTADEWIPFVEVLEFQKVSIE